MNRVLSISFVVGIFGFLTLLFSFKGTGGIDSVFNKFKVYPTTTEIKIDSKEGKITINKMELTYHYDMRMIETILGKADRFIADTATVYYEEFGIDGEPPVPFPKSVINYYYVYDDLGLIFFTKGKQGSKNIMEKMVIKFENERKFSNTGEFKHQPKKNYNGVIFLNGLQIDPNSKLVPSHVNYRTDEFEIYGCWFGPTSIGGEIDRLYSTKSEVYMMFYLNTAQGQKLSYLELN